MSLLFFPSFGESLERGSRKQTKADNIVLANRTANMNAHNAENAGVLLESFLIPKTTKKDALKGSEKMWEHNNLKSHYLHRWLDGMSKAMIDLIGFHLVLASCIDSNKQLRDSNPQIVSLHLRGGERKR